MAVLVLAGAVLSGVVLDRMVLDDERQGITEAQHDRLVRACNQAEDYTDPAGCTRFVAELVARAETQGMGYTKLAAEFEESMSSTNGGAPCIADDTLPDGSVSMEPC
ncbi:MAG TPA: hypothetical protein VKA42_07715 [Acidimicrobiales bacterium]|nr:hypothetical protein [Acidimicrobiales bacterium]